MINRKSVTAFPDLLDIMRQYLRGERRNWGRKEGVEDGVQVLGSMDRWMVVLFTERRKLRFLGKIMSSGLYILIWRSHIQMRCQFNNLKGKSTIYKSLLGERCSFGSQFILISV